MKGKGGMKMKHLFACLLMGCLLSSPAWGAEPAITLEEFLQKLEKAEPWTREKVEALLGIKLSERGGGGGRGGHWARGQFVFAKGLIVEEIDLEVEGSTGETNILSLSLDEKSSCFTRGDVEKLYPDAYIKTLTSHGDDGYIEEAPWGDWVFYFGPERKLECLTEIGVITNAFIKKYRKELR